MMRRLIGWLGLFAVTIAAYWPALGAGFIWDDDAHVTRPALRSLEGLRRIWFEAGATQQYYPVLHSAFWLEHRLWGDAALGYHLVNILLHATAACLFAAVLKRLWEVERVDPDALEPTWTPYLAGLIFALHPVCVESVAWISEQKNTLSAVFYLWAAMTYLGRARPPVFAELRRGKPGGPVGPGGPEGERRLWPARRSGPTYACATLLFILALLSKSVTATLPAALLVVLWWRKGRLSWRDDVVPLLPWFLLAAAAGLFTAWVERTYIGAHGARFDLSAAQRGLLAGRTSLFYLSKLIWPAKLIFIYPHWKIDAEAAGPYLAAVALLALLAAAWAVRRRTRGPLAALLFFLGTLFPALGFFNVYPFIFSYVADHFQYLASMGIVALVVGPDRPSSPSYAGASRAGRSGPGVCPARPAVGPYLLMALACILGVLTFRQCRIYRDDRTLYQTTLRQNPEAWLAHLNLGNLLLDDGRAGEALGHYRAAERLEPDYPTTHYDIAQLMMRQERLADAIAEFEQGLRILPGDAAARNNLGIALARSDRPRDAEIQLRESIRLKPDYARAHGNLGSVLLVLKRPAEAARECETALRLDPTLSQARSNLELAREALGAGGAGAP